jgi:formylglycine-generating enzyme required for sulfatase activity
MKKRYLVLVAALGGVALVVVVSYLISLSPAREIRLSDPIAGAASRPATVYEQWPFDSAEAIRRQAETAKALGIPQETSILFDGRAAMKLRLIPAGTFMMGSPETETGRFEDEGPQHQVRITQPFYLAVCPVTQEQFRAVMGQNPSGFTGKTNPVENVSWNEAVEFCRRVSDDAKVKMRLPTEAEWEYACRAGTATPFYTGQTISTNLANYNGNYVYGSGTKGIDRETTVPVGSFAPNPFGLYDMAGNIRQVCSDPCTQSVDKYEVQGETNDPRGPSDGDYRIDRGSSWGDHPWACRSAGRGRIGPNERGLEVGFRIVVSIEK